MNKKIIITAAAVAIAISGLSFGASDAEAKRGGTTYQQWEYDSDNPIKGYEGFGGDRGQYCSYRREPERKCWETSSGYERCTIVGWRMIQKCY